MSAWVAAHGLAFRDALQHARATPFASLLSVLALAAGLALPLAGSAVIAGLQRIAGAFDTDPQLSVFLPPQASAKDRQALEKLLRAKPEIKRLRTITKEQALTDLQRIEGVRDLLAGLPDNPLPDTLVVVPARRNREAVKALQAELQRLPGVAAVQADAAWVERLEAIVATGERLVAGLALMLGVAVVAVTFNTIRLQVLTRAAELDIAALFGATRAWLRRPFLYFGALQGLVAGLAAVALVEILIRLIGRGAGDLGGAGVLGGRVRRAAVDACARRHRHLRAPRLARRVAVGQRAPWSGAAAALNRSGVLDGRIPQLAGNSCVLTTRGGSEIRPRRSPEREAHRGPHLAARGASSDVPCARAGTYGTRSSRGIGPIPYL